MTAPSQSGGAAPLILCIEDEEALRRDLVEELQEAGYGVIEAAGGADALAQLESFRPDLILCDICMPGMDGYDLLKRLQDKAGDYADVPFIFLTALADRQEVLDGKRRGADDYLVKPVDFDLLLATVDARLRQIRRIREQSRRAEDDVSARLDAAASDAGVAAVLDLLSTAIVLIDGARQVAFSNRAARGFADVCPDLQLALDQLEHGPRHRSGFSAWLDEMLAGLDPGSVSSFAFPRREAESDLMMVGCKLNPPGGDGAALALFMTGPSGASTLSPEVLASLFGFTPTESLIAAGLARGDSPSDISTALGIAQTTVAFHIRNIFQKTGVSRQASLVALLLTSPASIL